MNDGLIMRYSVTLPDGSRMSVGLQGITADQVALVQWLQAEQAWHRKVVQDERARTEKHREDTRRRRVAAKRERLRAEHDERVADASGFREQALIRHAPRFADFPRVLCTTCVTTDYEPDPVEFPCAEYVFARDWGI